MKYAAHIRFIFNNINKVQFDRAIIMQHLNSSKTIGQMRQRKGGIIWGSSNAVLRLRTWSSLVQVMARRLFGAPITSD